MPLISVIIPTYNRAHLIQNAINSLLNQTFTDYETIIIDDCSTDKTKEVIKSYSFSKLVYIYNEKNLGPAVSRNIGIKKASGSYIAFLDSDDQWLPEKLEKQYAKFKSCGDDIGVVYTRSYLKNGADLIPYLPYKWIKKHTGNIYGELLKNNFVDTPASMIRREVFEQVGLFDETFSSLEDYDLFLRIAKLYHYELIDEPLLISNISSDGVNSKNLAQNAEMLLMILHKHIDDYNQNRYCLASIYYNIGDYYYQTGHYKLGEFYIDKSIELNRNLFLMIINYLVIKPGLNKACYLFVRRILNKLHYLLTGKGTYFA